MKISNHLQDNINYIEEIYGGNGDVIKRKFPLGRHQTVEAYILLIDNMANSMLIESMVIRPLMLTDNPILSAGSNLTDTLIDIGIFAADLREETDMDNLVLAVMSGDTAMFIEGSSSAVIIASRGFAGRGVPSAETEIVVQGSKEAFSESLRTNTMLIRRRVRTQELMIHQQTICSRSRTDIAVVYVKDIVREQVLQEVMSRINDIDTDAIFDIGYVDQFLEDDYLSPFPQGQITERPDKVASSILDGRIAIIVDNSPFVLLVPSVISCFFQSPEDYYGKFEIMSLSRLIRYFGGITSVILPGLYLAIVLYTPNMIPTELMFRMASARASVPFPAIVEILIMDTAFELLKEAGVRLPSAIGSTIGVVGGIIIGQAAVEAGIVSPIVVIIIALTSICGFTLPSISLVGGIRISKYALILLGGLFGLLGFWLGVIIILIHLASLKSFGFPYLYPFVSSEQNDYSDMKDTFFRPPLFKMKRRAIFSRPDERRKS